MKVSGTGVVDISSSVVDRRIALEYYNVLYGEGDFEMDTSNRVSTSADQIAEVNGSSTPFNLVETTKMSFSGKTPLIGMKYINSKEFWGGIGASMQESFAVTEMEKVQTTYFSSTMPKTSQQGESSSSDQASDQDTASLKWPTHMVAMKTTNSFNGSWESNAAWHKIFYKDVKEHEAFNGRFDVEKTLQFHENAVPEPRVSPCIGIDC